MRAAVSGTGTPLSLMHHPSLPPTATRPCLLLVYLWGLEESILNLAQNPHLFVYFFGFE
jgi:hypothetical protein